MEEENSFYILFLIFKLEAGFANTTGKTEVSN